MTTDLTDLLRRMPGYAHQIAHVQPLPPRAARFALPAAPLPPALEAALAARGVTRLYAHQAAAIDAARAGDHMAVVTATASGKTLCYQLPALEAVLDDPANRALFLFPTKALAQDQLRSLHELLAALGDAERPARETLSPLAVGPASRIIAATLDGDTPRGDRDTVRTRAQIILSNPDMLHRTLLPDHQRWSALLAHLRYVVLDESHTYRGVFGTHVALIMRRLRRLCAHYGSAPQFICCSATSANPQEHLSALVGAPVKLIDEDGAPQGARSFVLWNPPTIEPRTGTHRVNQEPRGHSTASGSRLSVLGSAGEGGRRRSTNIETANLLATLVRADVKTLTFTRTRRGAELVLRYTREALQNSGSLLANRVAAYRAGYTPEERRRLELAFMSGELLGLVSTNALELGVDIGGVDAVIIGGFPGTVASAWQQAGRAGRSAGHSLAALVAQDDPLDQFYMRHPEQFFARPHEHARVALENPYILTDQLRCAAAELPLHDADTLWFGPTYLGLREWLLRHGDLVALDDPAAGAESALRMVSTSRHPAAQVNIRSADGDPIVLRDVESGRTIEQLSATRAPFEVYPGAIYLHQGDSYLVSALNGRSADARRTQVSYYTQPIEETTIKIERTQQERQVGPAKLCLGVVEVTRQVTGYRRKEHHSEALLSEHDLTLPPQTFRTIAVWWIVPQELARRVETVCGDVVDGLHAMEHACIGLLPLFAQCDRADIGGLSQDMHPNTGAATVFVYDGVPGGVGIAQIGYEQAEEWWRQTRALLQDCPCADGCPACIQSPKCGNGNQHLSKIGAAALAALLLDLPMPAPSTLSSRSQAAGTNGAVTAASLLEDLRGRLARARATPPGPRRAALLVALRYRISVERANGAQGDGQAELALIEAETLALDRSRV